MRDPLVLGSRTRIGAGELAYERLKELIVNGELTPGHHLSEADLAARLGTSRTPLRAAIERLQSDHLVSRLPSGRVCIVPLSATEARELFAVRAALESLTAAEAARRIDDRTAVRLSEVARALRLAAGSGLVAEAARLGDEFHCALIELADNSVAIWVLGQLRDHVRRYRRLGLGRDRELRVRSAREHAEILDLVLARDPEGAAFGMRTHLLHAAETVVSYLQPLNNHET